MQVQHSQPSSEPATVQTQPPEQTNTEAAFSALPSTEASQSSPASRSRSQTQNLRGARRPAAGPRFSARRSKEERDALDRVEEERRKARELGEPGTASSTAAFGTTAGRGRGRGSGDGHGGRVRGRGRGGPVAGAGAGENVASGPFSAGTVSADIGKRKRGGSIAGGRQLGSRSERLPSDRQGAEGDVEGSGASGGAGQGPNSASKSKPATGATARTRAARIKKEGQPKVEGDGDIAILGLSDVKAEDRDGGYISPDPDTEDEGRRMNVEQIQHIDLTGDDDESEVVSQGAKNGRPLPLSRPPVRLPRRDYAALELATKRESSPTGATQDGSAEVVQRDSNGDVGGEDPPRRRRNAKGKDVEFIRGERRWQGVYQDDEDTEMSIKQEPSDDIIAVDSVPPQTDDGETLKEPPSSPEKKKKDGKDMEKAKVQGSNSSFHTTQDKHELERQQQDIQLLLQELGQAAIVDQSAASEVRDGRVYIFQLPPVVPDLVRSAAAIKQEQEQQASTGQDATEGPPVISRPDKKPVKIEDKDTTAKQLQDLNRPSLSSGKAGKLRVHESGRTTLNWGGMSMELSMGSQQGCIEEVLMVKGLNEEESEPGRSEKESFGLGVVRGKFVLTPDWEEIVP